MAVKSTPSSGINVTVPVPTLNCFPTHTDSDKPSIVVLSPEAPAFRNPATTFSYRHNFNGFAPAATIPPNVMAVGRPVTHRNAAIMFTWDRATDAEFFNINSHNSSSIALQHASIPYSSYTSLYKLFVEVKFVRKYSCQCIFGSSVREISNKLEPLVISILRISLWNVMFPSLSSFTT